MDLKQYVLDEANKGNIRFGNNKVINALIKSHVSPKLRFHDVSHQLSHEVSDYLLNKFKIELLIEFSTHTSIYDFIPVNSINAQIALHHKYKLLEEAQKDFIKTKTLFDGRIRYYLRDKGPDNPGYTKGNLRVIEYNPKTRRVVEFMANYDHHGNTTMVHIKSINGIQAVVNHFPMIKVERELLKSEKNKK